MEDLHALDNLQLAHRYRDEVTRVYGREAGERVAAVASVTENQILLSIIDNADDIPAPTSLTRYQLLNEIRALGARPSKAAE
ncbi:MAG: hypothetical protein LC737_07240 [Chloroflexi bacterium]|nr:hypothetical protein [Chloroflexota bacterium]